MTDDEVRAMFKRDIAPWVFEMGIELGQRTETGMKFTLPPNERLTRDGGIICGQALAALGDTVGVLTLVAHNDEERQLTTTNMGVQFLRPAMLGPLEMEVFIQSNGRRMANLRVEFRSGDPAKLVAAANCSYAYL